MPAEAGQVEYQIGGDPPLGEPEEGTDFGALADGYVSITPVHLDMTAYHLMSTLQGWVQGKFLNFNGAAQFLALLWPFMALWFLCLPSHRLNRQDDVQRQRREDHP